MEPLYGQAFHSLHSEPPGLTHLPGLSIPICSILNKLVLPEPWVGVGDTCLDQAGLLEAQRGQGHLPSLRFQSITLKIKEYPNKASKTMAF